MKKVKRFLTGLLSAALALSLCAMPAMAERRLITSTIDPSIPGSLTIYKYEGNERDPDKLLDGVTFTAYKVADIVQSTDTTTGTTDVKMQPVEALTNIKSDIQITSETTYENIKDTVDAALANDTLTAFGTATTGAPNGKGIALFEHMPVGVYLIVETDAPSQIVNKTANFLVSIPMTEADEEETYWNYDIKVYPKNTAVYGGINLKKYGKNYNPDGTSTEVALSGAKFYLQRKDGDNWVPVTAPTVSEGNGSVDEDGLLTTNAGGMINITDLAPGTYRFIEYSAPQGYIMDGQAAYEFTIENNQSVTINDAYKDDTLKDTIKVVNEKPSMEKQVKTGVDAYGKATDASVGDVVTWKVTAAVPSNVNKLAKYILTDTMSSALTWVDAEANLTIEPNQNVDLAEGTDYTLTVPEDGKEGGTWTIEFTTAGKEKLAASKVTSISVTFNTRLNKNATVNNKGNLNDASLTYSNGFKSNDEEYPTQPDPKDEVIKNEASVYTFGMNIEKVDGKDSRGKLQGAEFDLYLYKGSEENPTEADLKNPDKAVKVGHYTTDVYGEIHVSGLKNGTYYLVETKAPTYNVVENGETKTYSYNLLKEPVKVVVAVEYEVTTTTTIKTDANGNVTTNKIESKKYVGGENNSGNYKVIIKNNKGFNLPTTGGFGTLLFSGIGVLLVVAGVGVLLSLKKKNRA